MRFGHRHIRGNRGRTEKQLRGAPRQGPAQALIVLVPAPSAQDGERTDEGDRPSTVNTAVHTAAMSRALPWRLVCTRGRGGTVIVWRRQPLSKNTQGQKGGL
jgi:hypothetical protein